MRYTMLACILSITACGLPAWNGNPIHCEVMVDGMCVNGLSADEVGAALSAATETFGPIDAKGYLVEGVQGEFGCGSVNIANGCADITHKYIKVSVDSFQCPVWILGHELGHVAIGDREHSGIQWGRWYMRRTLCP